MRIFASAIAMIILVCITCASQATEHSCPMVENLKIKRDRSIEISEQGILWKGWSDGENGAILSFIDATYTPDAENKSNRRTSSRQSPIGPVFCRYRTEYGSVLLYENTPLNAEVALRHEDRWLKLSNLQSSARICLGPSTNQCTFSLDSVDSVPSD